MKANLPFILSNLNWIISRKILILVIFFTENRNSQKNKRSEHYKKLQKAICKWRVCEWASERESHQSKVKTATVLLAMASSSCQNCKIFCSPLSLIHFIQPHYHSHPLFFFNLIFFPLLSQHNFILFFSHFESIRLSVIFFFSLSHKKIFRRWLLL